MFFRNKLTKKHLIYFYVFFPFCIYIRKGGIKVGVVETAEWLHLYYGRPEKLCEKFTKYIPLPKERLYRFLISKGMYRPVMRGEQEIKELEKKEIWKELSMEYDKLKNG